MRDVVLFEKLEGHIAVVTLNRPEKLNAINAAVTQGLDAAVKRAEADPDIWVAILTSSNDRAFCAGADLAEVAKGNHQGLNTEDGGFAGFVNYRRLKPWIAAPKGATVAGGLELCLACDMIVAAENCTFGLSEAKRGLVAGAGGATRLAKRIPLGIALEMISTGKVIDAQRAYALGLANLVVPTAETLNGAIDFARSITANAPVAVREAIRLMKQSQTESDEEGQRATERVRARIMTTDDAKEGAVAFVEKRQAEWTGR
jgi:enoyl-CoA hydratase/carnithine racemase